MTGESSMRGFTLIEVMVSLSLSMLMLSLAWSGFIQMRKAVHSNQARAFMALESSTLYRRMEHDVAATVPGVQMRLESLADLDAQYGGARAVRLIAMREQASMYPNGGQDVVIWGRDQPAGAVWYCWEWRPPTVAEIAEAAARGGKATGSIWHATSSAQRRGHQYDLFVSAADGTPQAKSSVTFEQMVAFRRSRLRTDLDDNDLRLLEGWPLHGQRAYDRVTGTTRPLTVDGDRTDLMRQRGFVEQNVLSCSIGWIDHQGYLTRATAAGVTVLDPSGSVVPHPGQAHWNAEVRIVDGLWRDGRTTGSPDGLASAGDRVAAQAAPPDEGDIGLGPTTVQNCVQARPAVVFVNFVLYDPRSRTEAAYAFSMQATITSPASGNL